MSRQRPRARGRAGRSFLVAVLVLVSGSLALPDSVDTWAATQPAGWRRSLVRTWADPVGDLGRRLRLDEPMAVMADLVDTDPTMVTLPPAERPATVTTRQPAASPTTTWPTVASPTTTGQPAVTTSGQPSVSPSTTPSTTAAPPEQPSAMVASTTIAATAPEPAPSTTPPTPAFRTASPEEPLRVLAVGDSLMLDLQYGLERVLDPRPDVVVEGRGALGFGFTVPHWDWDDDVLADYADMVASFQPDVVVVMIGANEFQGYALEGEDLEPGSERWREVLLERADDAMSRWRAGGATVYWWTTPAMRGAGYLTDDLNGVWATTVDAWMEGAGMIDSMAILGGPDGAYRESIEDSDGSPIPLRKEHGVHFFEVGADLLAMQLEDRLVVDGWLVYRG
ncbi:MAG TPA: DUF459 domain-containing protein [Acidimicrobiia bacterium]|nr:DUF459 domain-containing protein [Acidimicrobiia bacterium]